MPEGARCQTARMPNGAKGENCGDVEQGVLNLAQSEVALWHLATCGTCAVRHLRRSAFCALRQLAPFDFVVMPVTRREICDSESL
jgi:hypothetical protein